MYILLGKYKENMRFWFYKYKPMLVKKMFPEYGIWSWFFQYIPIIMGQWHLLPIMNRLKTFQVSAKKSYAGLNQCNLKKFGKNLNFMRS